MGVIVVLAIRFTNFFPNGEEMGWGGGGGNIEFLAHRCTLYSRCGKLSVYIAAHDDVFYSQHCSLFM